MSQLSRLHPSSSFNIQPQEDILENLLANKRSENTRRAYAKDLKDFFVTMAGVEPDRNLIAEFLQLTRFNATALVLKYKAVLIDRNLSEATINRRLAAIKSLVNYARQIGMCDYSLDDIAGEKVKAYRDTSGVSLEAYRQVLDIVDRTTLKGKRDYAILRLLWDNALRRGELVKANINDFDPDRRSLTIYGKGRGTQAETISLSQSTVEALQDWLCDSREANRLRHRGKAKRNEPLFIALDRASYGHRLTGTAIYKIVQAMAAAAGLKKRLSPHRVRHSGITAALDATGGNVRMVQKLSRHARLDTLMVYDDNRQNHQAEVTDLLAAMVEQKSGVGSRESGVIFN
jgi:integrase/recombinase XerC